MKKQQQKTMKRIGVMPTALAMAISSVAATQAFAETPNHNFGLYLRSDLVQTSPDGADTDPVGFQTSEVRMNFAGDLNEKTSYRIRFRLNKDTEEGSQGDDIDNSSDSLRYAYLTRKVSDTVKVRAGKHFAPASGGREGDYSGLDVYHYSLAGNKVLAYKTGVSGYFDVAGQSLSVSVFNGDGTEEQDSGGLAYGVGYYGDFAGGMVQPIASYYVSNSSDHAAVADDPATFADETKAEEEAATDTFLSAGVRVNFAPAHVELDYLAVTQGGHGDGADDTEISSIVLKVGADLMGGKIKPQVKYSTSESETGSAKEEQDAFAVALEYYPEPEWRVHAAYISESNTDVNDDETTDNQMLVGFSFAFTNG